MGERAPRPWLAALLGVLCNGLGHLYAGRPLLAGVIQLAWLAGLVALLATLRVGPVAVAAAVVAVAAFWIGQAVHARAVARRAAPGPRARWSHPLALVAFYGATAAVSPLVTPLLRSTVAHTVYVPGGSMLPTVQVGDLLAVAAGQPRPLRGGVVEIEPPAGSQGRDKLLKRIVAIGGDTVELRDGALWVNGAAVPRTPTPGECRDLARHPDGWHEEPCLDFTETLDGREYHTHCTPGRECGSLAPLQVPADQVWLAGDRRDRSADSRVFGPVAVSSIRGEARWVILSWGPRGLRWERIGLELR